MSAQQITGEAVPTVVTRHAIGRRAETDAAIAALPVESQAGLRQFSAERLTGYGVDPADAVELRARVLDGQSWQQVATELAGPCLHRAAAAPDGGGAPTRIHFLRRASALLRASQLLMLTDTDERRAIFTRAAVHYRDAAELSGDRLPVVLDSAPGRVRGWLLPAQGVAVASAVVVGGVEGWAMDFDCVGEALAARGVDALMLDAPGQGETRFTDGHYLTADWRAAYRAAVDLLDARAPGRPIGVVGNSMGGSFAMAVAGDDPRIGACVDNGGPPAPWRVPRSMTTFFAKMMAVCGTTDADRATDVWATVTPLVAGPNAGYPLLVVQGGNDPLVPTDTAHTLLADAPTDDKRMVVFSDGDHCIYNHRNDRDALIADWLRARLVGMPDPDLTS